MTIMSNTQLNVGAIDVIGVNGAAVGKFGENIYAVDYCNHEAEMPAPSVTLSIHAYVLLPGTLWSPAVVRKLVNNGVFRLRSQRRSFVRAFAAAAAVSEGEVRLVSLDAKVCGTGQQCGLAGAADSGATVATAMIEAVFGIGLREILGQNSIDHLNSDSTTLAQRLDRAGSELVQHLQSPYCTRMFAKLLRVHDISDSPEARGEMKAGALTEANVRLGVPTLSRGWRWAGVRHELAPTPVPTPVPRTLAPTSAHTPPPLLSELALDAQRADVELAGAITTAESSGSVSGSGGGETNRSNEPPHVRGNERIAAGLIFVLACGSFVCAFIAIRSLGKTAADGATSASQLWHRVKRSLGMASNDEWGSVREYTPLTRISRPFSRPLGEGGIALPIYQEELVA
jgi:hypothetical protein